MNCVENLPIYAALVVALLAAQVSSAMIDRLASTILIARVLQSTIHVSLEQTSLIASIRFALFLLQVLCMLAIGILIAVSAE